MTRKDGWRSGWGLRVAVGLTCTFAMATPGAAQLREVVNERDDVEFDGIVEAGVNREGQVFFESGSGTWVESADGMLVQAIPGSFTAGGTTFTQRSFASPTTTFNGLGQLASRPVVDEGPMIVFYDPREPELRLIVDPRSPLPDQAAPPVSVGAPFLNELGQVAFVADGTLFFYDAGATFAALSEGDMLPDGGVLVEIDGSAMGLTNESAVYFRGSIDYGGDYPVSAIVRYLDTAIGGSTSVIVKEGSMVDGLSFPVSGVVLRGVSPDGETLLAQMNTTDPATCGPDVVLPPGGVCLMESAWMISIGGSWSVVFWPDGALPREWTGQFDDPGPDYYVSSVGPISMHPGGDGATFILDIEQREEPFGARRIVLVRGDDALSRYVLTRTGDAISSSADSGVVAAIANVHTAANDVYVEGAFEDGRSFLVAGLGGRNTSDQRASMFLAEDGMVDVGDGVVRTFSRVRRLPIGGPFAGLLRNANGPYFGVFVAVENGISVWVTRAPTSGGGGGGGSSACSVGHRSGSSPMLLLGVLTALAALRRRRAPPSGSP